MNPFSIRCTTCLASLVVRDEQAIGQILACPKCNSMVLVQPQGESATETVAAPDAENHTSPGESSFEDTAAVLGVQASDADAHVEADTSTDQTTKPAGDALPTADWTSSSTLQLKQYFMTGAAGIAGITVALSGILYFMSGSDADPAPRQVTAADRETTPISNVKDPTIEDIDAPDSTSDDTGSDNHDTGSDSENTSSDDATTPNNDTDPPPSEETVDLVADEELTPNERADDQNPNVVEEPDGPPDLLIEDSFLDDAVAPDVPAPAPDTEAAPIVAPSADENTIAGRPEPTKRTVDVGKQLAVQLPAIEFDGTTLADFLAVISRLTTVPITIDLDALAWARVNLDTPVSVKLEDATIEEILAAALGSIRLSTVVEAHDVLVTVKSRKDALRQHRFPVEDLLEAENAKQPLAAMVQQFVHPDTWAVHGGNATLSLDAKELVVSQTDQGLLDVLLFLEQLRVARGLLQQTKYPHELLQVESPTLMAIAAVDQRVSLNFSQPTALADILKRLGNEVGMRIVVDWRMAGQMGWSPATETTLVVEEKSLEDSLNALLRPLKLGFRIVNTRTIQVTTGERIARRRHLEMYPLPTSSNMTATDIANQVRNLPALSDEARATIHVDTRSEYLLAWLTQTEHVALARAVAALQP